MKVTNIQIQSECPNCKEEVLIEMSEEDEEYLNCMTEEFRCDMCGTLVKAILPDVEFE